MSELLDQLRAKYPHWSNIRSEPLGDCRCNGTGEIHTDELSVPCLCVCLSGDDAFRLGAIKALGRAMRRIRDNT